MEATFWKLICQKIETHRVADGSNKDLYLNPIIEDIYLRESAFACNVIKANYLRTKDSKYYLDYKLTVNAIIRRIQDYGLASLKEPIIGTRFHKMKSGSLPASIILIHALDRAIGISNVNRRIDINIVSSLVHNCQVGKGSYSHDAISTSKKKPPIVLNTSAMVSYFHSRIQGSKGNKLLEDTFMFLVNNQRGDGLWTYCDINSFDKLIWRNQKYVGRKCTKAYNYIKQDKSIFFGDYLHHVVTLYYLTCALENKPIYTAQLRPSLGKALAFINNNSIVEKNKAHLNYEWEPILSNIRHCNFRDSSTYFYLTAALVKLAKLDKDLVKIVPRVETYINYIMEDLWNAREECFNPYDTGDMDLLNKIMKRPAESIFDKAFLYSVTAEGL